MKFYQWIIGLCIIFYLYDYYGLYCSKNRYKLRTSNEVKNMILNIEETNSTTRVLTLWHYYLVRKESDNLYFVVCFMKQHLKEEAWYKRRVNQYSISKLKECPVEPLSLIKDYNTEWDNAIAWLLQFKDSSLHLIRSESKK